MTQVRMMAEFKTSGVGNECKKDLTCCEIFSFTLQILMQERGRLLEMLLFSRRTKKDNKKF